MTRASSNDPLALLYCWPIPPGPGGRVKGLFAYPFITL